LDDLDHFVLDPIVRQLDWNLLRTFIVIVQEKSLTGAANRLLLTQPAISSALKKLETRLGAKLIERGGRAFSVTPEGLALFAECLAVYGQIAALPARLDAVQKKVTGTVNIAAASGAASDILDEALDVFHASYPDVALSINISSSVNATQSVRANVAPLAICYAQSTFETLNYDHLREVVFGLYCGPRHRLYGRWDVDLSDLAGESFISFQTDRLADDQWPEELLRFRQKMSFRTIGNSFNLSEVFRMVSANLGIGLFPVSTVLRAEEDGRLWRLPPRDDSLKASVYLITNPAKRVTIGEAAFIDVVRQLARRPRISERASRHRVPIKSSD
jgi:DNA-binding transcriptional LysR family regulator